MCIRDRLWPPLVRIFSDRLSPEKCTTAIVPVSYTHLSVIIFIFGIIYITVHVYRARSLGKKPFLFVEESKLGDEYLGYEKSIFYLRTLKPAEEEKDTDEKFEEVSDEDKYWEKGEDYEEESLTEKYFGADNEDSGEDAPETDGQSESCLLYTSICSLSVEFLSLNG